MPSLAPTVQLPLELTRECMEIAARSDKRCRLKLMLLSWDVCRWIQPIAYESLTFGSHYLEKTRLSSFLQAMQHGSKPEDFFQTSVKSLLLLNHIDPLDMQQLIGSCLQLKRFGYWSHSDLDRKTVQMLSVLPLERLSLSCSSGFHDLLELTRLTPKLPVCMTLTHLDLTYVGIPEPEEIEHLTGLTHIMGDIVGRHFHEPLERTLAILKDRPSLVTVVLQTYGADRVRKHLQMLGSEEPRLVLMRPVDVPSDDWNANWDGVSDMWDIAEEIVQDRVRAKTSSQAS